MTIQKKRLQNRCFFRRIEAGLKNSERESYGSSSPGFRMEKVGRARMKKNDRILAAGILLFAGLSGFFLYGSRSRGASVVIEVDGEEYGCYSLQEDQIIEINGTNRLQIADGSASMIYGDCPDQICVRTAPIEHVHDVIVCMPNRVTVEVREN